MSALWLLAGCASSPEPAGASLSPTGTPTEPPSTAATAAPTGDSGAAPLLCPEVAATEVAGVVTDERLVEVSGLAWANDLLWTHNDSGGPVLYGLTPQGVVAQVVTVEGMPVFDWEDMAVLDGTLWLADVGDNLAARTHITLYAVPVPAPGQEWVTARALQLTWPDGARDCETLLADPVTGDLVLLSKEIDGDVRVGRVVDPLADEGVLEEVARVRFGPDGFGTGTYVTGGDVAPDGRGVVIRQYLDLLAFPRRPGESWAETFAREPCALDFLSESQGEAVAWTPGALYTLSEGERPPLHRMVLAP